MIDYYDVNRPNYFSVGLEVVARFARDVQSFMRASLPSHDPDKISGILNPSDSFVRSKEESRHRDCTELCPLNKRPKPRRWPSRVSTWIEIDLTSVLGSKRTGICVGDRN